MWLILYNSSTKKMLTFSELHVRHNLSVFTVSQKNISQKSWSRIFVDSRPTLWCFIPEWISFWTNQWFNNLFIKKVACFISTWISHFERNVWMNDSMNYSLKQGLVATYLQVVLVSYLFIHDRSKSAKRPA